MMKEKTIGLLMLLAAILTSCSFSQRYGLTDTPAGNLAMEILDRSTVTSSDRTVIYTSFSTTQPEWGDYLFTDVYLISPKGNEKYYRIGAKDIRLHEDDNFRLTATTNLNPIEQGLYVLKLFAGKTSVEEEYLYEMDLSIDDTGRDLSTRLGRDSGGTAPFIMEGESSYEIAVSGTDSIEYIHIKPRNDYSATLFTTFIFTYLNQTEYILTIEPQFWEGTDWISAPASDKLIPVVSQPRELPLELYSNNNWSVVSYASAFSTESWGELIRSEMYSAEKSDETVEVQASIIAPSGRSISPQKQTLDTIKLSPLFRQMLENDDFGF